VGRDVLPAGVDRRRPAVWEARRSLRPQAGPAGRARAVPDRLRVVRPGADHAAADRLPRRAGSWWRRSHRRCDGRRGRSRRTARPRPLPGTVRGRVRGRDRRRAATRRLLRRQPLLALDLLHQPPARRARAGHHLERLPSSAADGGAPPHRLARDRRACRWAVRRDPLHQPRRHDVRVGRARDARGDHRRRCAARAVPARRVARVRTDPAARALPQPDVPDDERDQLRARVRTLRVGDVRAALPAGGQGAHPRPSRAS
jgi:hypothetical protein